MFGLMMLFMRDLGRIIRLMVRESSCIQMGIIIKGNGRMTKPMDLEFLYMQRLRLVLRDIGKTICSMVQVLKLIVMVTGMKECSRMEKETAKEAITTPQDKYTEGIGTMVKSKVSAFAHGQITKNTKVNGWTTKSTAKASTFGQTAENMREIIDKTRSMDLELTLGQMEGSMLVSGKMIKGMEGESTI